MPSRSAVNSRGPRAGRARGLPGCWLRLAGRAETQDAEAGPVLLGASGSSRWSAPGSPPSSASRCPSAWPRSRRRRSSSSRAADEGTAVARMPWGTILMVVGMSTLVGVLEQTGGMALFTSHRGWRAPPPSNGTIAFVTACISPPTAARPAWCCTSGGAGLVRAGVAIRSPSRSASTWARRWWTSLPPSTWGARARVAAVADAVASRPLPTAEPRACP